MEAVEITAHLQPSAATCTIQTPQFLKTAMQLETARQHIRNCRDRMSSLFQKPVFDEWAVIAIKGGRAAILDYDGPRKDSFAQELLSDAALLCDAMEGKQYGPGDFEFVQTAAGSSFDAAVKLGEGTFLLCNHTEGTMEELRAAPLWREAQKPFVFFCEKFHSDPLV